MSNAPTVAVIVVAAGSGTRLAADAPKAFVRLDSRTMLEHSLRPVADLKPTVFTVVVAPADWQEQARAAMDGAGISAEHSCVVPGGETRHDSVTAGLAALPSGITIVLVHDAARALTPVSVFEAVIDGVAASDHGIVPVLPVPDALKRVVDARVVESIDRGALVAAQTPQGFPRAELEAAYARSHGADTVDDVFLFSAHHGVVDTVMGSATSFKITYADDLARARALVSGLPSNLVVGTATDTHAWGTEQGLRLAGLDWPEEKRLDGHSDGDAVAHAIVDALLVAAGLGDIGALAGTDDPAMAGVAGDVFISRAVQLLAEHGYRPVNVTAQIVGNRPRFAGRRAEAEAVLTAWVGAPVSLSATTTDGLGFTGEGLGLAVIATALVQKG